MDIADIKSRLASIVADLTSLGALVEEAERSAIPGSANPGLAPIFAARNSAEDLRGFAAGLDVIGGDLAGLRVAVLAGLPA